MITVLGIYDEFKEFQEFWREDHSSRGLSSPL